MSLPFSKTIQSLPIYFRVKPKFLQWPTRLYMICWLLTSLTLSPTILLFALKHARQVPALGPLHLLFLLPGLFLPHLFSLSSVINLNITFSVSPSLATLLKIAPPSPKLVVYTLPGFSFLLRIYFYLFVLLVIYFSEVCYFQWWLQHWLPSHKLFSNVTLPFPIKKWS